ncbi:uncharacterized protein DS421_20g697310 [Arachis hypogaea]|nr:uncharacterized protein DS421_20g697310 [Arachis hypogaea]
MVVQNAVVSRVSQHFFDVLLFLRTLNFGIMHATKFSEYAKIGMLIVQGCGWGNVENGSSSLW